MTNATLTGGRAFFRFRAAGAVRLSRTWRRLRWVVRTSWRSVRAVNSVNVGSSLV